MEAFCNVIRQYLELENLHNIYQFNPINAINNSSFFYQEDKNTLFSNNNIFEINVRLKKILQKKLLEETNNKELYFWIINVWGGIGAFKNNENNLNKIDIFLKALRRREPINQNIFNNISSLSKIASFVDPYNYAIYDAKAIYALNWLICQEISQRPNHQLKFFPMRDTVSRNVFIQNNPMSMFCNNFPNQLFHDESRAYYEYCNMLKLINPVLFPHYPTEIFRTEMLLFASVKPGFGNFYK